MSTSVKWTPAKNPSQELYTVLVLLKNDHVGYGYYTKAKGWWIYSKHNGFICTDDVVAWKPLQ